MADPTLASGGTTLTFRPGQFVVTNIPDEARQNRLVSSDGTVRIIEVSATEDRTLEVEIVKLPESDETHAGTTYAGRDSLRSFIRSTVNYAESTATLTDSDGDSFTVRYWSESFTLREEKQQVWSGTLPFRVEV